MSGTDDAKWKFGEACDGPIPRLLGMADPAPHSNHGRRRNRAPDSSVCLKRVGSKHVRRMVVAGRVSTAGADWAVGVLPMLSLADRTLDGSRLPSRISAECFLTAVAIVYHRVESLGRRCPLERVQSLCRVDSQ